MEALIGRSGPEKTVFHRLVAVFPALLVVAGVSGLTLVYSRDLQDLFDLPKRGAFGIAGLAGVLAVLVLRCVRDRTVRLPWDALLLPLFFGAGAVSLSRALSPPQGAEILRDFIHLAAWWLLGALAVTDPRRLRVVIAAIAAAGTATAALGILQALGLDLHPGDWGFPGQRLFERLPAVDRPGSAFGHVNMASEVVCMGWLAALGLAQGPGGPAPGASTRPWVRPLAWTALAIMSWFLVLGGCRAAWFGAGIGALAILAVRLRSCGDASGRRRILGRAGLALAVASVALLALDRWITVPGRGGGPPERPLGRLADLVSLDDGTERERLVLWRNTLGMIRAHPALGVGPGNWEIEYPRFAREAAILSEDRFSLARQPEAAHMDLLQVVAETGAAGASILILAVLIGIVRLGRAAVRGGDASAVAIVLGTGAISAGAYVFQNPVPSSFAFLLLGAGAGLARPGGESGFRVRRPVLAGGAVAAAVLLALSATGSWNRIAADRDYFLAAHERRAARAPAAEGGLAGAGARQVLERARDRLDRAAMRRPAELRYQLERAMVLWDLGLGDAAEAVFDRVLALHPLQMNTLLFKSMLVLQAGDTRGLTRFAEAYELLEKAIRIQPDAPEFRFAIAHLLEAFAAETGDPRWEARTEAVQQYREAVRRRDYMPLARLALARLLLESGGGIDEVLGLLAKAEENASLEPDRLAECARLYAHPRLAGAAAGIFGPAGVRTLATWRRVLALTRDQHDEALLEVRMAPINRELAGGEPPEGREVEALLVLAEGIAVRDPMNLLARYYRALILERLGREPEALADWGAILRSGRQAKWRNPRFREILDRAVEAEARMRNRGGLAPPGGGR